MFTRSLRRSSREARFDSPSPKASGCIPSAFRTPYSCKFYHDLHSCLYKSAGRADSAVPQALFRRPCSRKGVNGAALPPITRIVRSQYSTRAVKAASSAIDLFRTFEASGRLRISDEVRAALNDNTPVVALESTIYTHGLPYPDNIGLAVELESILRKTGVVPATIGFLDGVATIGLSSTELFDLASSATNPSTMKISRRDMPYIIGMGISGKKFHGGTTVAATMYLAELAGIKVFATGGIGGVHRGGQDTMDVSADLNELGRTRMCVIASGCKSFLDIPRTLEYLETQGATVATYSDKGEEKMPFPAFYTRDSGVPSPLVVKSPEEAASIIYAQELLGSNYGAGFLLANPIPEEFAVPKESIDAAIEAAVAEADRQGMRGHANTPFILAHIKKVTAGKSLVANRALIKSNVQLAAEVIKSYHKIVPATSFRAASTGAEPTSVTPSDARTLVKSDEKPAPGPISIVDSSKEVNTQSPSPDIVVCGALAVDLSCDFSPASTANGGDEQTPTLHTSNPATIKATLGGVGHNVALAAHRASSGGLHVSLRTVVADDLAGKLALEGLAEEGLDTRDVQVLPGLQRHGEPGTPTTINRTAQYVAFNDNKKDLIMAMADMSILDTRTLRSPSEQSSTQRGEAAKWAVIDGNLAPEAIYQEVRTFRQANTKIIFEPVSAYKSVKLFEATPTKPKTKFLSCFPNHDINIATPNQYELAAMHKAASERGLFETADWWTTINALGIPSSGARDRFVHLTDAQLTDEGIPVQSVQLLPFIPTILTKLGPLGVLHTEILKPSDPRLTDPASARYLLSRNMEGESPIGGVYMRLYPPAEVVEDVVSVNGVGDTFVGVLVAGLANGMPLDEDLIGIAQKGAVKTLRSHESVSPDITGILKWVKGSSN